MTRLVAFALSMVFLISCSYTNETADIVYYNAKIWTGDSSAPWASAVAIKGNTIIYSGNNYSSYKGEKTTMVDLEGKLLVPGFMDNHTHFLSGGYNLASVDLRKAHSKQEFISILKEYCEKYPDDRWILGGDWDHEAWGGELPEKEWIDSITGNHPVLLSRYDGHMALVNTKALSYANIDNKSKVPAGGEILKNSSGDITGVFKDEAMNLIYSVIPTPSEKELEESLDRAQKYAFSNGVTQVHDMGSYGGWFDLEVYRKAYKDQQLQLRIYSFVALSTWQQLDSFCRVNGKGDDQLRWGGLKGFVYGSLGSTTAWFYDPYLDEPLKRGFNITDTVLLKKWVIGADKAGLQIAVHAIGDRANDFILDVFKSAVSENGQRDRRFRIEHAQHLSEAAISRFGVENIIPSMQPYHAIDDGKWAYKRLDSARLKRTYPFKSLLQSNAKLSFGSDWTVAPLTPLEGIYAAVTRQTLDGKNPGGWFPEQKISVEEALRCYTIANAYAGFEEKKLGKIKKDYLADFVILSDNIFEIAPESIRNTKVLQTIINGKEVFNSSKK